MNSRIQILTVAVQGATSREACKGYNRKDKTIAETLALCSQKGHITGNAGEYFLLAFSNGNIEAFLKAANLLIDKNNEAFSPEKILNAIPEFTSKATTKQLSEFGKIVVDKGHSSKECDEKFDQLNTKISGDIYSCLLSAEAAAVTGDYSSVIAAVEIWKNGYAEIFPNETHATRLENRVKEDPNADGITILSMLRENPKEHFNRAIQLFNDKRLTKSEVTEALELEFILFSQNRWFEFTGEANAASQIETLIETVNLSELKPEVLAEFLAHLVKNELELANRDKIKTALASIEFKIDWANILTDIAFDAAGTFITQHVSQNCDALQLAIDNDGLVPQPKLEDAKVKLLPQCDIFNISSEDLQRLIDENADDGFKRLGIILTSDTKPSCDLVSLYLTNEDLIKQSSESFKYEPEKHIKRCMMQNPAVSYIYSVNLLDSGDYSRAFEISSRGCERKSFSSCAVAGYIMYYKLLDEKMENMVANRKANRFLKIGYENFDGNSTMLYLSVNRPSATKFNIFTGMRAEKATEIEEQLREKNFSGMPIVEAESCLANKISGRCRAACKPVENFIKNPTTDKLQRLHGKRVIKVSRCE